MGRGGADCYLGYYLDGFWGPGQFLSSALFLDYQYLVKKFIFGSEALMLVLASCSSESSSIKYHAGKSLLGCCCPNEIKFKKRISSP